MRAEGVCQKLFRKNYKQVLIILVQKPQHKCLNFWIPSTTYRPVSHDVSACISRELLFCVSPKSNSSILVGNFLIITPFTSKVQSDEYVSGCVDSSYNSSGCSSHQFRLFMYTFKRKWSSLVNTIYLTGRELNMLHSI